MAGDPLETDGHLFQSFADIGHLKLKNKGKLQSITLLHYLFFFSLGKAHQVHLMLRAKSYEGD